MTYGGNNFNHFPENQLTRFKLCLVNVLIFALPRISVTHFVSPRVPLDAPGDPWPTLPVQKWWPIWPMTLWPVSVSVASETCMSGIAALIYATADEAVAYMFYRWFFCFFSIHQKYETTVLGNGWTDFHETFTKGYRGNAQRRAAAWRMANVDDLRNLRYDSGAITRGRHPRRLRYKIMSIWVDLS